MRLKGGKLLLDSIIPIPIDSEDTIQLTSEQTRTILDKGLSLRIKFQGYYVCVDVVWSEFELDTNDELYLLKMPLYSGGALWYKIALNITDNQIKFEEQ